MEEPHVAPEPQVAGPCLRGRWRSVLPWLLSVLGLSLVLTVSVWSSSVDDVSTPHAPLPRPLHTLLRDTLPRDTLPLHTLPLHTLPRPLHTLPLHTLPRDTLPRDTLPRDTLPRFTVDCPAIYDMDPVEVGRALVLRKPVMEERDEALVNLTSNCGAFLRSRGYNDVCATQEERLFPVAYSLVVHKDAWMVERLIRALYSPHNVFCVHYDEKSSEKFRAAMESLAQCLPNVLIASKRESVVYASFTRLKADLNCMSDLLKSEVKWKYMINLCGQDFPLRTNLELVIELSKLKGGNMLETCRPVQYKSDRYKYHYEIQEVNDEYNKIPVRTDREKKPPPHEIEMFTGSAYFVLSRDFVEYVQSSDVVRDFLAWSEDTYSPDEHFWATLVRLPGVPGEVPRSQPDITGLMSKTRLVKWHSEEDSLYPRCTGEHRRSVCIYGVGELRWLLNYGHWFANKFDPKIDPVVIHCLEEILQKKQKFLQSLTSSVCY